MSSLADKFKDEKRNQYYKELIEVRKAYFLAIKKGDYFPDYYKKNPKVNRDDYPCDLFPHIFLGTKLK